MKRRTRGTFYQVNGDSHPVTSIREREGGDAFQMCQGGLDVANVCKYIPVMVWVIDFVQVLKELVEPLCFNSIVIFSE